MCRIVARLSVAAQSSGDLLWGDRCSLLAQSLADPGRLQRDGWGVGLWRGRSWYLTRRARPIFHDRSMVEQLAAARTTTVLAHVRQASNPLGLPSYRLLRPSNCRPFQDGRWLFAHNGTLLIVRDVLQALGHDRWRVRSDNDSEALFRWLMRYMEDDPRRDPSRAIPAMVAGLWGLWRRCARRYPALAAPCSLLNIVLTDGERLWACCYEARPHRRSSRALCARWVPFVQMAFRPGRRDLAVASEPTGASPDWRPLPHGHLLIASRTSRRIEWRLQALGFLGL